MRTNTVQGQMGRSLFYDATGSARTWFCIALYPVALLVITLGLVVVAVLGPLVLIVGAIGASCHWLSKVGR